MLHANYFSGRFVVSWPMKLCSTLSLLIVQFKGILRTQPSISVVQITLKSECSEFWLLNRQVITRNTSWSEEFSWSDLFSIVLHRNTLAFFSKYRSQGLYTYPGPFTLSLPREPQSTLSLLIVQLRVACRTRSSIYVGSLLRK